MSANTDDDLIRQAVQARTHAYAPYSHFQVGAALCTASGEVYTGCNIENAAWSPSICAERTAFFKAVSAGERQFTAIAVIGGPASAAAEDLPCCPPCGVCRQVMQEFCDPQTFRIILADGNGEKKIYTLAEMLPHSFTL